MLSLAFGNLKPMELFPCAASMGVSDLDLKAALPSITMPHGKLFSELQMKPIQID